MEYTYRLLTEDNLKDLNSLYESAFQTTFTEGLFLWKYFSNPAGKAIVAGAFDGVTLVGSGAMVPEVLNVFGKEEIVFKCTDLMTDPAHQKKGISKKINELLNIETAKYKPPFNYTLCSKISTKSFLKNNWNYVEAVINFFKPAIYLKITVLFRSKRFSSLKFYDSVENHLDNFPFKVDGDPIAVRKTSSYLKWRTSNPNFIYKMICSYDNSNAVNGYLIYSITPGNFINIIDFEAKGGDKVILKKLFNSIEYLAVKGKYKALLAMAIKGTGLFHYLKRRKFLYNPFANGPLVSALDFDVFYIDKTVQKRNNISDWNFSGINYDDV